MMPRSKSTDLGKDSYEGTSYGGAGKAQERFRTFVKPLSQVLWRINIEGLDNLPASGAAILCPNHISFIDSVFVATHAGRNVSFVGKAEYMDSWKTRKLFPMLGMIPIDRAGGSKSQGALLAAEEVLRRGDLFGIYPEGTRSRDGMLYKGHTGAARLALTVGCPLYPVGIIGTREIQPPDTFFPKFRKECTIRFGRPIDVSRYANREGDHMVLREITDELMFEIRELSGQEYRNVYASQRSESIPTEQVVIEDQEIESGRSMYVP